MTGTIRNKPTRRLSENSRRYTRAARSRVRASNYRESSVKRRKYRHDRRDITDGLVEKSFIEEPCFVAEKDIDAYVEKMLEKTSLWYDTPRTHVFEQSLNTSTSRSMRFEEATQRAIDKKYEEDEAERRLINIALTVGCNI